MGVFESIENNIKMIIKNPRIALASVLNYIPSVLMYILLISAWFNFNKTYAFKDILIQAFQSNDFSIISKSFNYSQMLLFFAPYIAGAFIILVIFLVFNLILDLFYVEAGNQFVKGKINMDKCLSKAFKFLPEILFVYLISFLIFSILSLVLFLFVIIPVVGFFVFLAFFISLLFYIFTLFMLPVFVLEQKTKGFETLKRSFRFSLKNFFGIFFSILIFAISQTIVVSSASILPIIGYFIAAITELFFTAWIKSMPFFLYYDKIKTKQFK